MTNRPVAISSSTSAPPFEMPSPGAVSSASTALLEYTAATARTATKPPTSCAIQYGTTSLTGNFRATARPRDTAGLKWPPETCPNAAIASARPRPNANAIPRVLIAPPPRSTETAIALKPRKKNRKVPSASAARRRPIGGESISLSFLDEPVRLRRRGREHRHRSCRRQTTACRRVRFARMLSHRGRETTTSFSNATETRGPQQLLRFLRCGRGA